MDLVRIKKDLERPTLSAAAARFRRRRLEQAKRPPQLAIALALLNSLPAQAVESCLVAIDA
jgi:hypothetical protein